MKRIKAYLKNYLTPNDQKVLMILLFIGFISILAMSKPFNKLYSNEVSPDSIFADIKEPYLLSVDIRKATARELTQIKGIGEKTAEKIVDFRDKHGYNSIYDLLQVEGIGEKRLSGWIEFLTPLPNDSLYFIERESEIAPLSSNQNKIEFNSATLQDLMRVNGIGEKKAKLIIEFRNSRKGVANLDELLSIKGIGKKTLAKIEDLFYIGKK